MQYLSFLPMGLRLTAAVGNAQEDRQCSFHPEISKVSDIIVAARQAVQDPEEALCDAAHRLYLHDSARKDCARRNAADEYYSQFTFAPVINPISSQIIEASKLSQQADAVLHHTHEVHEDVNSTGCCHNVSGTVCLQVCYICSARPLL